MKFVYSLIFVAILSAFNCAQAAHYIVRKDFTTFKVDETADEPYFYSYEHAIKELAKGDTIEIQGKNFEIINYLGQGNTTRIFEIANGRAVRLPRTMDMVWWNRFYLQSARQLNGPGDFYVRVFEEESADNGQYVVVEKVNALFTFEDFIDAKRNGQSSIKGYHRDLLVEKFFEFAQETFAYSSLSPDFHPRQVAFDGNRWILLDWSRPIKKITFTYDKIPIADFGKAQAVTSAEMKKAVELIIEKRKRICENLFRRVRPY